MKISASPLSYIIYSVSPKNEEKIALGAIIIEINNCTLYFSPNKLKIINELYGEAYFSEIQDIINTMSNYFNFMINNKNIIQISIFDEIVKLRNKFATHLTIDSPGIFEKDEDMSIAEYMEEEFL